MSTWVQHMSGQGEKWELSDDQSPCDRGEWRVESKEVRGAYLYLPQSEYVECSPPEKWQDVTDECEFSEVHNHLNLSAARAMAGQYVPLVSGYRFKKVFLTDNRYLNTWVLKVEKRQP